VSFSHSVCSLTKSIQQNDDCDSAIPLRGRTVIVQGSTVGATLDSSGVVACGTSITAPGVWYEFVAVGGSTSTTISTSGENTNYDTKLHVFHGQCSSLTCLAGNDNVDPDLTSTITIPAIAGERYYVLVSGFSSYAGDFELTVSAQVGQDPCLEACKDADNIGQCLRAECPLGFGDVPADETVCDDWKTTRFFGQCNAYCEAMDCNHRADDSESCVEALAKFRDDTGEDPPCLVPPPLGNCLTPNEDAGCENAACEATVCSIDPYCCNDVWDGLCTGEAAMLCESPIFGDCLTSNPTKGCENPECEAIVCADAFCCNVQWDGICASAALRDCVA
jgi:hypothetical protein